MGPFAIQGPERYLPSWLINDYHNLYVKRLSLRNLNFSVPSAFSSDSQPASIPPAPDFGEFCSLQSFNPSTSAEPHAWPSQLVFYRPEDHEIRSELEQLDCNCAVCSSLSEDQLETFWSGDLGDRYWAIVRSGIQKGTKPRDSTLKDQIIHKLTPSSGGGFGQPGSINTMLVAMLYFSGFYESR